MDFTLNELKNEPGYKSASGSQQGAMEYEYTKSAWDEASQNILYGGGTRQTRQQFRDTFDLEHPMGSLTRPPEENDESDLFRDLGNQLESGTEATKGAFEVGVQAQEGVGQYRMAELIAESNKRRERQYVPPALKAAQANMLAVSKRGDRAIFFEEKMKALGHTIAATVKEAVFNPKGTALLATESLPNMIAPIVAGAAGGFTAGPAGAAAGIFAGSFATEQGAYLREAIIKEVHRRGQEVTEANIHAITNDPELIKQFQNASYRKAAATAGTDTALSFLGGKVATSTVRNIPAKALASNKTKLLKIAEKGGAVAAEIASEPISEAAGQLAAEGKVDYGELMGEALGGIGTSGGMTAANVAMFGTKKVKPKKKGELPPGTLTLDHVNSPAAAGYKEDVSKRVETGDVEDISNPGPEYDPYKAVDVLQKTNQEKVSVAGKLTNLDKAQKVYSDLDQKKQSLKAEAREIASMENAIDEDVAKVQSLVAEAKLADEVMKRVDPLIKSMGDVSSAVDQEVIMEDINDALNSGDNQSVRDSILSIFGSKRGADLTTKTDLNTVLDNPKIDVSTKDQVNKVISYQEAEKSLISKQSDPLTKTSKDVHSDIIEGGPGFNGIKTYAQGITLSLIGGDTKTAEKQLNTLKSFAEGHKKKSDTFTEVYNAGVSKQPVSESAQTEMVKHDTERLNRGFDDKYNLSTPNAKGLVETITLESDALNKAVAMMESWVNTSDTSISLPSAKADNTETRDVVGSGATEDGVATAKTTEDSTRTETSKGEVLEGGTGTDTQTTIQPKEDIPTIPEEMSIEDVQSAMEEVSTEEAIYNKLSDKDLDVVKKAVPESSTDRKAIDKIITSRKEETKPEVKKEEVLVTKEASDTQKAMTESVKSDPGNQIKDTYEAKKAKSILHTTDNVLDIMNKESMETAGVFNKKNPMDEDAVGVIDSISDYGKQFTKAFNKEFKVKENKNFRFEDPIQYLLDENSIPSATVINALMAASYKWLGSRASETKHNYTDDIRSMLGLEDEAYINKHAHNLLGDIGVTATMLQESLGKEVFQLLNINPSEASDHNSQNKLELSLGLQAIATMQSMGVLTQTDVLRGAAPGKETDTVTGYQGLINSLTDEDQSKYNDLENNFFVPEGKGAFQSYKGQGFISFYRIALTEQGDIKKTIEDRIIEPFSKSKNTWDRIFKGENDKRNYSWEALPKGAKQLKLKGTTFNASQEQTKNLQKHQNKPYNASSRTMGFYQLLSNKNLDAIQGRQDTINVHAEHIKNVEGVNAGIDRTNRQVHEWLADAGKQEKGLESEFQIPEEFWRQGRMGQIGDINPQGNKTHRFLFNMKAWERELDVTDTDIQEQFMEAVALGFDIEVSKEGGLQQAIQKTQNLLETPVMQDAIAAVHTILDGQGDMDTLTLADPEIRKFYINEMDAISEGAVAGEMGMHSFKTIIEYAQYQRAVIAGDTKFNTDLTTEIDGVSNGIAIARIQLMSNEANMAQTLTALQNAGISFSNMQPGLAQHLARDLSHDAYKAVGSAWSDALVRVELGITDNQELRQFKALESLFGEFRDKDTGEVSNTVRKLSKGPTMQTVYGMGNNTLIQELGDTLIDSIYTEIEKAVTDNNVDALRDLNRNVKSLTGRNLFDATAVTDNKINRDTVLTEKLTYPDIAAIRKAVENLHGKALDSAITEVYGDIQKTFKPLNNGISMSAVLYNSIQKIKVQQAEALATKENREVTVGELKAIEDSIQDMFPNVVTYFGEKMPLAKKSRDKQYSHKAAGVTNKEVNQSYNTLAGKKAAPYSINGLESPGVGGTILTIHNQDSGVANTTMGKMDILNNHDGFTIGVGQARDLGHTANTSFYDIMQKFDMGTELHKATQLIVDEFVKQQSALLKSGVTQAEINKAISSEFKSMGTYSFHPVGAEKAITITADNYQNAMKHFISDMKRVADETQANKKILTDAMVKVEQYSYAGGEFTTGNNTSTIEFQDEKFNPFTITEESEKRLNKAMEDTNEMATAIGEVAVQEAIQDPVSQKADKEMGSSVESSKLSVDEADYATKQRVSSMNAMDVYDQIKDNSTITDSPAHDAHLRDILNSIIQKVLNPIDVHLKENPDIEPEGIFIHTGSSRDKAFISSQNRIIGPVSGILSQGIRMSTGEVYTHELLHSVIHKGLDKNKRLHIKVKSLFNIANKELGKDGYKAFMNDPASTDVYEIQAAKERYDYVFRNTDTQKTSEFYKGIDTATGEPRIQERSNYLHEFLVMALTNENFGKAIAGIKLSETTYNNSSWDGIRGSNIQEMLGNIAKLVMDFILQKFSSKDSATHMDQELKDLVVLLSKKDSEEKGAIYLALAKVGTQVSKASTYGNAFIKNAVGSAPVIKTLKKTKEVLEYAEAKDTSLGKHMRLTRDKYHRLDQGLIKSAVTEISGRTDRMAWLHKLLSSRQVRLDQAKQQASDTYMASFNEAFENPLTDVEKTAFTKAGLKTDASALNNSLGLDGLRDVLSDPKALSKEINAVINKMEKDADLEPHSTYFRTAADALGYFMVHGRSRSGVIPFQSTRVIAALRNTDNADLLTESQIDKADALIDQLASLYAVRYTKNSQKTTLVNLIKKDPNGVEGVFGMHEVLKADSLENSFSGNKFKFTKGYTKQILNSRINIQYGMLEDEAQLTKEGYVRNPTPIKRDGDEITAGTEDMYMYVSKADRVNDLLSMIFSFTGNVAKGTSLTDIAHNMNMPGKFGADRDQGIIDKKRYTIQNMTDPAYKPTLEQGTFMVPQVDNKGDITKYRYMMTEETKDTHMEQVTAADKILGSMAGQIVDKVKSPEINFELITGLHAVYKDGYQKNPEGFVEIGPNSSDSRLREIYFMMPPKAKADVQEVWGTQSIFIPKDFVDISFGYRQYSIVDAFAKKPEDRARLEKIIVGISKQFLENLPNFATKSTAHTDKAAQRLGTLEAVASELTKFAKSNIIVKSLHVTLNNLGSNMIYLKSTGIPVATILKFGWEAIAMGNKYQADSKQLDKLTLKRKALKKGKHTANQMKNIDSQIVRLKHEIYRNPTTKTIQAGLMPALVDDISTVTSGSNFPTEFEKTVEKVVDRLPEVVQRVGRVVALTEDTNMFKTLNNAVKMTDFIGRHIMYTSNVKGGMAHEEAVAKAEDAFVNFNIPTHQIIEYLNKIGVLWFTKYALRILKVIKDSVVDKPFDVFMAYMLSVHSGMDNIVNSTPTGIDYVLNHTSNPISMATDSVNEALILGQIF